MAVRANPRQDGDMDTFITLAGLALATLVPLGIVAGIRALAGGDDQSTDLATFFAPVAGALLRDPSLARPAFREDEPVRWNFGSAGLTGSAA
jgi:hypothetical protein